LPQVLRPGSAISIGPSASEFQLDADSGRRTYTTALELALLGLRWHGGGKRVETLM
jgi:hypothetical protein